MANDFNKELLFYLSVRTNKLEKIVTKTHADKLERRRILLREEGILLKRKENLEGVDLTLDRHFRFTFIGHWIYFLLTHHPEIDCSKYLPIIEKE